MAIIRKKELRNMSKDDLSKKLGELKLESIKAAKPSHGSSIKLREIRRTIARILTHMNLKQNQRK